MGDLHFVMGCLNSVNQVIRQLASASHQRYLHDVEYRTHRIMYHFNTTSIHLPLELSESWSTMKAHDRVEEDKHILG